MSSGPTQTKDARRQAGRVRVEVWLHEDHAAVLDLLCELHGLTRREVIERLLTSTECRNALRK